MDENTSYQWLFFKRAYSLVLAARKTTNARFLRHSLMV